MPERWVVIPEGASPENQRNFSQILAVHAALLPNGKVLYFGGSQHVYQNTPIRPDQMANSRLWNPESGDVEDVASPQPLYDLFCCGHAVLADGRLLVAGGTSGYIIGHGEHVDHGHYRGSRRAAIFDGTVSGSNPWRSVDDLRFTAAHSTNRPNPDGTTGGGGRWYPTLVALADRRVVAFGGHPQDADRRHSNTSVEVFTPDTHGSGSWLIVGDEPTAVITAVNQRFFPEVYPRAHLLPNGRVFVACLADGGSYTWDPYQRQSSLPDGWDRVADFRSGPTNVPNAWAAIYFDSLRPGYNRSFFAWSSVLLPLEPPDYEARVLIVGRERPFIINLGRPSESWPPDAQWQPTASRQNINGLFMPSPQRDAQSPETEFVGRGDPNGVRHPNTVGVRQQCIAVLMPDRTVLVIGGSTTQPSDWSGYHFDAVNVTEVFDPFHGPNGQWRTLSARQQVPRVYHGVALLLPDGRVWTAGSNPFGDGRAGIQPEGDWEERIELFEPWYFDRQRPVITNAPARVRHSTEFDVETPSAAGISRVALIRASSATHGEIFDQRYVGLAFVRSAANRLRVTAPPDGFIAPPGFYLLYVADHQNVPSHGRFVHVERGWEPWFSLGPNTFPTGAPVSAMSTRRDESAVYIVGVDEGHGGGRVWTSAYPGAQPGAWGPWRPLGDQTFHPGTPVTVLSLGPGRTSLYAVGQDEARDGGRVFTNAFPVNGQWGGWRPVGENVFPLDAPVAAASTQPDGTSLFVIGRDTAGQGGGQVWTNAFQDGTWAGWVPLGDNVFPVGAAVAALSLFPGHTSLYVVGLNNEGRGGGRVWTKFFPDPQRGAGWSEWLALGEQVFPAGAPVSGISTHTGSTSLYVVGLDNEGRGGGRVWTKAFPDPINRNDWGPWRLIGNNVFRPGSRVAAISLGPGRTGLYVPGLDGRVWSAFFPVEGGRWSEWFAIDENRFVLGAPISVITTVPDGTSLFAAGPDNQIWSTYYAP